MLKYAPAGSGHCGVSMANFIIIARAVPWGKVRHDFSAGLRAYRQRPVRRAGGKHAQARAAQPRNPNPPFAAGAAAQVGVGVEEVDDPDMGEALQALQAVLWYVAPAQQPRQCLSSDKSHIKAILMCISEHRS